MEFGADLSKLRSLVRSTDFCFTDRAFEGTQRLFFLCRQESVAWEDLRERTPEYGRAEYLLNTDGDGSVIASSQEVIRNWAETCRVDGSFDEWFQEEPCAPTPRHCAMARTPGGIPSPLGPAVPG